MTGCLCIALAGKMVPFVDTLLICGKLKFTCSIMSRNERLVIELFYLVTNAFIIAGVLHHW